MQDLKDLLASPEGVGFLESRDIFVAQEEFVARLRKPVQEGLIESVPLERTKPVYALQQLYVDCTQSMLDRMALLDRLEQHEDCFPFFLWIDTDQAGTDPLMLRFFWPLFGKKASVRLSAAANDQLELRFIPIDTSRVHQALDKLNSYVSQSITGRKKVTRARARDRYEQLETVFLQPTNGFQSELNHRVTYFLLDQQAGLNPFSVLVSDLLGRGLMTAEVNLFLNHIDDAIRVFNDAVQALQARDIDPKVKPLAADYLPLNFSCPDCRRRLRLRREVRGRDHFAVASCKCQKQYRFHLGSRRLSVDDVAESGAWSPDVSLTLLMNDFVSGYVGGGSSGVYYGLVMKDVLEKVLHKRRVPILLPQPTGVHGGGPEVSDSLLYRYLMIGGHGQTS